jgi:hypothetical protein
LVLALILIVFCCILSSETFSDMFFHSCMHKQLKFLGNINPKVQKFIIYIIRNADLYLTVSYNHVGCHGITVSWIITADHFHYWSMKFNVLQNLNFLSYAGHGNKCYGGITMGKITLKYLLLKSFIYMTHHTWSFSVAFKCSFMTILARLQNHICSKFFLSVYTALHNGEKVLKNIVLSADIYMVHCIKYIGQNAIFASCALP